MKIYFLQCSNISSSNVYLVIGLLVIIISNNNILPQFTVTEQLRAKNIIAEVLLLRFEIKVVDPDFPFVIHQSCDGSQGK